jgi:hypothetical protein
MLSIEQTAEVRQVSQTLGLMGQQAGFLSRLVSHDIRRGAAKPLSKIPKTAMKTHNSGVARAMGHKSKSMGRYYNGDEDRALVTLKKDLPPSRVDTSLIRAKEPYRKPTRTETTKMINNALLTKGDEVIGKRTRGFEGFRPPSPLHNKDDINEWCNVRRLIGIRVRREHYEIWAQNAAAVEETCERSQQAVVLTVH